MTIFVRIRSHPTEPLIVGQPAAVVGMDWIPWHGAGDPVGMLLEVMIATGARFMLRQHEVELIDG